MPKHISTIKNKTMAIAKLSQVLNNLLTGNWRTYRVPPIKIFFITPYPEKVRNETTTHWLQKFWKWRYRLHNKLFGKSKYCVLWLRKISNTKTPFIIVVLIRDKGFSSLPRFRIVAKHITIINSTYKNTVYSPPKKFITTLN